jgi:hypothetical protein
MEENNTSTPDQLVVQPIMSEVAEQHRTVAITPNQLQPQTTPVHVSIDPQCGCGGGGGGTDAGAPVGYVFVVGNIVPRFPSQSLEEEYMYAYQEFKAEGPPNALYYQVLSQGQNLYIARQMCWVLQIDGVDTYIIVPRTDVELYQLIAALNPIDTGQIRFDVMVGVRGSLAPMAMCNGLQLPLVSCNLSYHFTFNQFVDHVVDSMPTIPRDVVSSMLQQMLQVADNAGETDAHRAINYLTTRSKDIYYMAWQMQQPSPLPPYPPGVFFLQSINAKPAAVQGNRSIVDIIFEYMSRDSNDVMYMYIKVDVTGMYPFLASKQIMRYYPAP